METEECGNERCTLSVTYRTLVISMVDSYADLPEFGVLFVYELSVHCLCISTVARVAACCGILPRQLSNCLLLCAGRNN